jgi:DNA-binding transcriptional MerR regulator
MNEQSSLWSGQSVAKELDISVASLRRWSDEFTDYLSEEAGASKNRSHRRYTDQDVRILRIIKELMNDGLTYEQVRKHLVDQSIDQPNAGSLFESPESDDPFVSGSHLSNLDNDEDVALVSTTNGSESPAIAFLTNTLSTLSDNQKSILNSQAANRELLGVLLQDNFNLKEENNRLRERILEVERDLARNRQEEEWRREALRQELDAKITAANQLAMEAIGLARSVEAPEIKAVESKPGCLGMLFGRGGTRIITAARFKQAKGKYDPRSASIPPSSTGLYQQNPTSGSATPPQQKHPKPTFPPE